MSLPKWNHWFWITLSTILLLLRCEAASHISLYDDLRPPPESSAFPSSSPPPAESSASPADQKVIVLPQSALSVAAAEPPLTVVTPSAVIEEKTPKVEISHSVSVISVKFSSSSSSSDVEEDLTSSAGDSIKHDERRKTIFAPPSSSTEDDAFAAPSISPQLITTRAQQSKTFETKEDEEKAALKSSSESVEKGLEIQQEEIINSTKEVLVESQPRWRPREEEPERIPKAIEIARKKDEEKINQATDSTTTVVSHYPDGNDIKDAEEQQQEPNFVEDKFLPLDKETEDLIGADGLYYYESEADLYDEYNITQEYHIPEESNGRTLFDHDESGEELLEVYNRVLKEERDNYSSAQDEQLLRDSSEQRDNVKAWMPMDNSAVVGIAVAAILFIVMGTIGILALVAYRESYYKPPARVVDDLCCLSCYSYGNGFGSSADSSSSSSEFAAGDDSGSFRSGRSTAGTISTIDCAGFDLPKDNFCEEMYNLDNDSFLNSLEAMAMPTSRWPNYNTDSDV